MRTGSCMRVSARKKRMPMCVLCVGVLLLMSVRLLLLLLLLQVQRLEVSLKCLS